MNTFMFVYEPRYLDFNLPATHPFITWNFQDPAILAISAAIGNHKLVIEKSRDMGATILNLAVIFWYWLFRPEFEALVCSRKEEFVYKKDDHKALFSKLDHFFRNLPSFLKPRRTYTKLHMKNHDNGACVDGESTNEDLSRGDRRTVILLDEFASVKEDYAVLEATNSNTNCILYNSTPKGAANAFYDIVTNENIKKIRLHWSEHPDKGAGLYHSENGKLIIDDKTYDFPDGYKFILDGKQRSPWYDKECRENPARVVAQEIDIEYMGSGGQYFPAELLSSHKIDYAQAPGKYALLEYDTNDDRVHNLILQATAPEHTAAFSIWSTDLDTKNRPPITAKFIIGIDVAQGTGASNSAISIVDARRREKVAEYVDPNIGPYQFAKLVLALARHYNDAFLIWEANGPGRDFGRHIIESGYGNIYFRAKREEGYGREYTQFPGWWSTTDTKQALIGTYRTALLRGTFINRSEYSLRDAAYYIHTTSGCPEHAKALRVEDESGARANHGDITIADALANRALTEINLETGGPSPNNPFRSFGGRQERYREKTKTGADSWYNE